VTWTALSWSTWGAMTSSPKLGAGGLRQFLQGRGRRRGGYYDPKFIASVGETAWRPGGFLTVPYSVVQGPCPLADE
jgi:hypothetical protein